MARLVFIEGANRGTVFPLDSPPVTLGRDPACELNLLDERVSRAHARIRREDASWIVEDLKSRNGTYVNSIPCESRPLSSGDEIRVGDSVLLFLEEGVGTPGSPSTSTKWFSNRKAGESGLHSSGISRRTEIVAESTEMKDVLRFVAKVAPTDSTVLITGESGTGKELIAQAIHQNSPRKDGPVIAINCAAITGTLFESEFFGHEKGAFTDAVARKVGRLELAEQGTIFLDEIGELATETQAKLLRVLATGDYQRVGGNQDLKADARVVAATNRDLKAAVKNGGFREDLFYRINVLHVDLPPLRRRPKDIRPLIELFFKQFKEETATPLKVISPEAMACLEKYAWPGNIRELRNLLERTVMLAEHEVLEPEHLPAEVHGNVATEVEDGAVDSLKEVEKRHVLRALKAVGWNKTRAAAVLGIDRKTLYSKIEEYGLKPEA